MPKYWGKQIFSLGSFPEVGQKQKTEKKEKEERLKVGNKNVQLRIANATWGDARKAPWAKILEVQTNRRTNSSRCKNIFVKTIFCTFLFFFGLITSSISSEQC